MVASREQRQQTSVAVEDEIKPGEGRIPRLSGDIRPLVPKLGLRNYWYPMVQAVKVSAKRPVKVRMLGEEIVAFRGASGRVVALHDVCPHRGALLSEGDCHYAGTVACPYHGWVYDEHGKLVAVLSEGPESKVCGKPGTEAKVYPTRTLKGVVFVWIGDEDPAPIEEDVPEEFFDKDALIVTGIETWKTNWEVALENSMDSHVNYLHRDAWVMARTGFAPRGAQGEEPVYVGNGFGGDVKPRLLAGPQPLQDEYPDLGWKWPKTNKRRVWTWAFKRVAAGAQAKIPLPKTAKWCGGHHLPGMYRAEFAYDLYTRMCVPVADWETRIWYYHYTRPVNRLERVWHIFLYNALHRFIIEKQFSAQDASVMFNQKYDHPEKLSGTDAEVVQWRRLVVTKHYGGRNAAYSYRNPDDMDPDNVPISRVSYGASRGQADVLG